MKVDKCHVCGSKAIIPDVQVVDRTDQGYKSSNLIVRIFRKPQALIFKESQEAEVKAWICGDCGHVELFVSDPNVLFEAWTAQQENLLR